MEARPEAVQWPSGRDPEQRRLAELLAERVRAHVPAADEAVKWRRLTFTLDEDWHQWLCAVAVSGRGVSLMLHKGALLDDPAGLLCGEGRYLRRLPAAAAVEHPEAVGALLRQAVEAPPVPAGASRAARTRPGRPPDRP